MTLPHDEPTIHADDPIVEDVRAQRDFIAAPLNYDLEALFERLTQVEESERKAGRLVLPVPGKPGAAA